VDGGAQLVLAVGLPLFEERLRDDDTGRRLPATEIFSMRKRGASSAGRAAGAARKNARRARTSREQRVPAGG
jgi:hypothetical protein